MEPDNPPPTRVQMRRFYLYFVGEFAWRALHIGYTRARRGCYLVVQVPRSEEE